MIEKIGLSKLYEDIERTYLHFKESCKLTMLEEQRDIAGMRDCKIAALRCGISLKNFVATLESESGYIDYPVNYR